MKPTFIINKSSYKGSTLYNIMESNGDAFARIHLLTDCIHFEDYNVWITDFEVVEEKRRQGYATAMLQLIQTLAPADETIALEVALDAPHWVVAFYEKHGIVISNKDALILDGEEKEEAERRIAELDQKVEELSCILKYFLYLCTRFTSKVWIKTEIYVVTNTVIDVPSPYFLHPKTG